MHLYFAHSVRGEKNYLQYLKEKLGLNGALTSLCFNKFKLAIVRQKSIFQRTAVPVLYHVMMYGCI